MASYKRTRDECLGQHFVSIHFVPVPEGLQANLRFKLIDQEIRSGCHFSPRGRRSIQLKQVRERNSDVILSQQPGVLCNTCAGCGVRGFKMFG
jgi:hypothetical protein